MAVKFSGTITALVTPFKEDLSVDIEAFKKLLDFQIDEGIDGIVVCGSTGESATLSTKEKLSLIITAVEHVNGRVPVIAGTGSNNTQASIDLTLLAREHGADGVLLVAPYYNKPDQEGLFNHYMAIAEAVDIPQIIYNVPGRSGVNIHPDIQLRLAEDVPHVVATKEASGDMEQIMSIIDNAPEDFAILSGDDALALPIVMMGGHGVISVLSNYAPKQFTETIAAGLKGNIKSAKKLHYKLFELMQANFVETNPIPVKTALSLMGKCEENFRLPMLPMKEDTKEFLEAAMKRAGYIK
jgi:4-hydroxy-tetrahydrodipicolinate synthase